MNTEQTSGSGQAVVPFVPDCYIVSRVGRGVNRFRLTVEDAQEVQHKMEVLRDDPGLLDSYGVTRESVAALIAALPKQGGYWHVPSALLPAVRGEMSTRVEVLRIIAADARNKGKPGQALAIYKQAKRLEAMLGGAW
jgi:hypothetical protein